MAADVNRGLSDKGAKMAAKTEAEAKTDEAEGGKKGGKKKLLLIAGPLVLVIVLAAVYMLVLKPSGSSGPKKVVHTPGAVVKLDPITINLAGGHFLKLGLSLQPDVSATETDGSKALDDAIELFSGKAVTELATKDGRDKAKATLVEMVSKSYEEKVYDVYFTEFVYQ